MRRKRPGNSNAPLPDTANQWFASSQTWQMEHSGVLQLGGKVLPLTGVMRLNLREKEILISIMSGFGLKLLAMKVRPETQEILYASPAADAIPHFIQHCADTLRALFLRFPDQAETCRNVGGLCVLEERIAGNVIRVGLDPQSGFFTAKDRCLRQRHWGLDNPLRFANSVSADGFPPKRFSAMPKRENIA